MKVIKPPALDKDFDVGEMKVFLAGSIEMGAAELWQDKLALLLKDVPNVTLFNPRRDQWDSSWDQDIKHEKFNEQVNWELDHLLNEAHIAVFYFDPCTRSPVTMLELGLAATEVENVIVCCPEGFWRKGNVDIVCERYELTQVDTLEEVAEEIIKSVITYTTYLRMSGYKKDRKFDEV